MTSEEMVDRFQAAANEFAAENPKDLRRKPKIKTKKLACGNIDVFVYPFPYHVQSIHDSTYGTPVRISNNTSTMPGAMGRKRWCRSTNMAGFSAYSRCRAQPKRLPRPLKKPTRS